MLATLFGLPKQSEILVIIFLGISFLSLDFSLFYLKSNLEAIWEIQLQKLKYLETVIKYLIASIVLVRTFTLHAFLAFYVVMLWSAIFEEKPNLMIPWLLLGILRCIIVNMITLALGVFICHKERGFLTLFCSEYILAQIIEHGPSVYAWMSVLSFYRELVARQDSQQSSAESLYTDEKLVIKSKENLIEGVRSYSLSDINIDSLFSNRTKNLQGISSVEQVIMETFTKRNITPDISKSFDSMIQRQFVQPESVLERAKRTLEVSDEDIFEAKKVVNRFARAVEDITMKDLENIDNISSTRSVHAPTSHVVRSQSQTEDVKAYECCLDYLKKQLQQSSNQTLIESEIANVTFNEEASSTSSCCRAMRKDSSEWRRVKGFNPNVFLQKFVLKRNTSKNFGCQVSIMRRGFLEESKSQLTKKLLFLRNFGLS